MSISKQEFVALARGEKPAELVLKHARVFDAFNQTFFTADVAVEGDTIVGVGQYTGRQELDLSRQFLLPGFIDGHMHVESSYLTPDRYAQVAMPHGVTTVVADPHEITNACGEAGLEFMRKSGESVPLEFRWMLPSCVPSTPFEHAGCSLTAADTVRLMQTGKYHGLGEMMNYPGLLGKDPEVLGKLEATGRIDGHAPTLTGNDLGAYIGTGIGNDHESVTPEEAAEKVRLGMYILLREGTVSKDIVNLLPAVTAKNCTRFAFCTDDKHIDDLLAHGSILDCLRVAIAAGLAPEMALAMATLHVAQCHGLEKVGAITPGYQADLVVCDETGILQVYKKGRLVAEKGKALFDVTPVADPAVRNTVNIRSLQPGDLTREFDPKVPVIEIVPDTLRTAKTYLPSGEGLNHLAVIERYQASGNIGRAFVKGIHIADGAIAQSIGHDSHNIIVMGDSDADMHLAVEALGRDGGIAVVKQGKCLAKLALPVGGLMTDAPVEQVLADQEQVLAAVAQLDGDGGKLLMILGFLPLLVIPELRLCDSGLFDVNAFSFIH